MIRIFYTVAAGWNQNEGVSRPSWSRRRIYAFQRRGKLNAGGLYRTATRRQGKSVYLEYRPYSLGKPEANRVQMAFRSALKLLYGPEGTRRQSAAGHCNDRGRLPRWRGGTQSDTYYVTLFYYALTSARVLPLNAGVVARATRQTDWCRHGSLHCALAKY